MTDNTENLVLTVLKDIQSRTKHLDERMGNLELQMTAQEQHLGTLVLSLPSIHDRLDALTRRVEHVERRLELTNADPIVHRRKYSLHGLGFAVRADSVVRLFRPFVKIIQVADAARAKAQ